MSGYAFGNPRKYIATRSKKAFKTSAHSEAHQRQFQITKIVLTSEKY